jgi:hypothetical protein
MNYLARSGLTNQDSAHYSEYVSEKRLHRYVGLCDDCMLMEEDRKMIFCKSCNQALVWKKYEIDYFHRELDKWRERGLKRKRNSKLDT